MAGYHDQRNAASRALRHVPAGSYLQRPRTVVSNALHDIAQGIARPRMTCNSDDHCGGMRDMKSSSRSLRRSCGGGYPRVSCA